jgi:muramidase (phage lysozyme)
MLSLDTWLPSCIEGYAITTGRQQGASLSTKSFHKRRSKLNANWLLYSTAYGRVSLMPHRFRDHQNQLLELEYKPERQERS